MGTDWAPTDQSAKSKSVHSYRVRDIRATRSPNRTPCAISPLARASTSSRKAAELTSRHCPPASLRPSATRCGSSSA